MNNIRYLSLDAFRGFTIAAMILVNNPGSWQHIYAPLEHAQWNGLTPTDLIFPFFLFIVGVSIVLAYSKRLSEGSNKNQLVRKIIFRSVKIFAVGVALNIIMNLSFKDIRIAGVLQRIAIVFLITSLLFLYTNWKTQTIIGIILLVFYWLTMTLIPTPGYPKAMLEPGINLAAWIDSKFLPGHMWQGTWDPEGIYSTLPAVVTGISGMLVGKIIITLPDQERKVIWLFLVGFITSIIGIIWSWRFPLNKNLWTSSYVLLTSGLATMTFASLILLVDMQNYKQFAKIGIVFGANAIAIYVLADLLTFIFYGIPVLKMSLSEHFMQLFNLAGWNLKLGSFLYALIYIAINFIPAWLLYRKKIFIRL
jgi:predicted acyltransferase